MDMNVCRAAAIEINVQTKNIVCNPVNRIMTAIANAAHLIIVVQTTYAWARSKMEISAGRMKNAYSDHVLLMAKAGIIYFHLWEMDFQ